MDKKKFKSFPFDFNYLARKKVKILKFSIEH